jgi:predicted metalloprotease with PDZ domain
LTSKILSLSLLAAATLLADPAIHYELSFPNAVHHEAEIQARFTGLTDQPLEVVMSRSSPGRYALHEFAKNISNFRATDGEGHKLKTDHTNTYTWIVTPQHGTVICSYTLYGDRVDGTYAAIDLTHAHLNLPATLVWARGLEHVPATLYFNVPPSSNWKAATQLIPNDDGSYSAPNLPGFAQEWMMDSSVELNASPILQWTQDGQTFRLALHQQGSDADAASFLQMCKTVVAEEREVFGEFPTYDNGTYTFLVDFLPYASGDGMEHRDSTVISAALDLRESAHRAIGIVSHEFFHSWNVKRIRPKSLEPFDFERADMSGELWFAEGFTNYYGILALRRANLNTFDEFVSEMGGAVNSVLNDPGRNVFSPVGMSDEAPFVDAARSIDPTNVANNFISYYTYGQALALGIDLAIRQRFPGKSLDDWMKTMWNEHPDVNKPYSLNELEHALAETTNDEQFAHEMFKDHIEGTMPLDYQKLLEPAGLSLVPRRPGETWLGSTRVNVGTAGLDIVGPTLRGSPLYLAGVDSGDSILECNHQNLKKLSDLDACVSAKKPGETVTLDVKGRSGTRTAVVTLTQDPSLQMVSFEHSGKPVSPEVLAFRIQWLSSKIAVTHK